MKSVMRFFRRRSARDHVDGPLDEVFEAEKAAVAAIASAKLEAEAWLTRERLATASATEAALQALAARASDDEEKARQAALADAAKMVVAAETFSREVHAVSEREMLPVVARHLASIIPGPPP